MLLADGYTTTLSATAPLEVVELALGPGEIVTGIGTDRSVIDVLSIDLFLHVNSYKLNEDIVQQTGRVNLSFIVFRTE